MFKDFIEKLQNSDEGTKKKWLVGLSGGAMVIVVFLWLMYMNATLNTINNTPADSTAPSTNFWSIFKNGLVITSGGAWNTIKKEAGAITEQIKNGASQITGSKTFTVNGNNGNQ